LVESADAVFVAALHSAAASHYRLAARMLGDEAEARDAVQEAWTRAWRQRDSLRDPAALHGWLRSIVARECLRSLRRRALRAWLPFSIVPEHADPGRPADASLVDAQQDARVRRALDSLSPRQRVAFGLRFHEGLDVGDIAAAMGIGTATVYTQIDRALVKIQAAVGGEHEG
jgi:RNA polymerase sigma-70 factor (ECF subfamily)